MPVLSDRDLLLAMARGDLQVEPFDAAALTPNGVDLRVAEVLVPSRAAEPVRSGVAEVPPLARFLVSTRERVVLGPAFAGQLWLRSSWARRGALAAFGKVEAGFDGTLTIGCFNASHEPLGVPVGDRFCQLAVEALSSPAEKVYAQRSGAYQGQQGITLARGGA